MIRTCIRVRLTNHFIFISVMICVVFDQLVVSYNSRHQDVILRFALLKPTVLLSEKDVLIAL